MLALLGTDYMCMIVYVNQAASGCLALCPKMKYS